VSVRSGAKFSMPGMMDTVLNLGLNETTLQGLIASPATSASAGTPTGASSSCSASIVLGISGDLFEHALGASQEQARQAAKDTDLSVAASRGDRGLQEIVRKESKGREFPDDPLDQLTWPSRRRLRSWFGKRANDYRNSKKIAHDLGTAVNVVTMVFGNMGDDSGTGVAFTRDPNTGEKVLFGEYLTNAQGEDVVAGIRTPKPIAAMAAEMPTVYASSSASPKRWRSTTATSRTWSSPSSAASSTCSRPAAPSAPPRRR
jgi:pyruvate,orthophosphate dikinase